MSFVKLIVQKGKKGLGPLKDLTSFALKCERVILVTTRASFDTGFYSKPATWLLNKLTYLES